MGTPLAPASFRKKPKPLINHRKIKEETRRKQAWALQLRAKGLSFQKMADEMGCSKLYARSLYNNAMTDIIAEDVDSLRKLENHRLDAMWNETLKIFHNFHPFVSGGAVVHTILKGPDNKPLLDEDGNPVAIPLEDQGSKLEAIKVLLKISERRSKVNGLDMPAKIAQTDPSGRLAAPVAQNPVLFYLPSNERDITPITVVNEE